MSMRRELMIGCGHSRAKKITFAEIPQAFENLTTLDIAPDVGADVVHDLRVLPLPFADSVFDEIHAIEVLEHCGAQGDWRLFFEQFNEFWRILKPGGYFIASTPMWDSHWAWSDPGHSRIISKHTLAFLCQQEYVNQVGKTHMTDYRHVYHADFEVMAVEESAHSWAFVLKALK